MSAIREIAERIRFGYGLRALGDELDGEAERVEQLEAALREIAGYIAVKAERSLTTAVEQQIAERILEVLAPEGGAEKPGWQHADSGGIHEDADEGGAEEKE